MTTRRIFSVLLVLILAVGLIPAEASAAPKPQPLYYVALGDSISRGTSVLPKQSYPSLMSVKLNAKLINFSRDGLDSAGLIYMLRKHSVVNSIKRANLITLTIGSNDVLGVFMDIIRKATGTTDWKKILKDPKKLEQVAAALNNPRTAMRLNRAIKNFRRNFSYIISRITRMNHKALVVVTTAYSPYKGIEIPTSPTTSFNLGLLSDQMIGGLNQVFSDMASSGAEICFVDITGLAASGMLNVVWNPPTTVNLDPHPNATGQQGIANLIYERIKDMLH